jgi:Ulp1 family protease
MKADFDQAAKWEGIARLLKGKYRYFFIPFCHHHHWTVAVISTNNTLLTIYDSLGRDGQKFIDILEKFMTHIKHQPLKVNYPSLMMQKNWDDCGVFLLKYVDSILQKEDPTRITQADVTFFRTVIRSDLETCIGVLPRHR